MDLNQITEKIIDAAIEIHKTLGLGLLESAYEECLCYELFGAGLHFQRQVNLPVLGLLINFNVPVLKDGIKRIVNKL